MILGSTRVHWIRRIPIRPEDRLGLHQLAKPILFIEDLQPNQFGPTQTYLWKPGDHINHSEAIQEDISCTSTHKIKRILLHSNFPYMEQTDINAQQLLIHQSMHELSFFQTTKKIPRKLTYPLKPSRYKKSTMYIHLAKNLFFMPPTASFSNHLICFLF